MSRSDNEAIRRACEAFQRSVLSLNPNDARAWPGTWHMEKAIDAYLEATVRAPRVDTGVEKLEQPTPSKPGPHVCYVRDGDLVFLGNGLIAKLGEVR